MQGRGAARAGPATAGQRVRVPRRVGARRLAIFVRCPRCSVRVWPVMQSEVKQVREARARAQAEERREIVDQAEVERQIAEMERQIAAMRASMPVEGKRKSPRVADCHGPKDAFTRSVNERMEYELPEMLQCSRKLKLDLPAVLGLERRELLQIFEWRRMHYEGQWVVLPSLVPEEVTRLDSAGAAAIHEPTSPRGVQLVRQSSIDAPNSFLGIKSFSIEPDGNSARPLHEFQWRRLFLGSLWICVPKLTPQEAHEIAGQLHTRLARGAYAPGVAEMVDDMSKLSGLLEDRTEYVFNQNAIIKHVVMIIVVEAEVAPILAQLGFDDDDVATANLMGLARVRTGMCGSYKLSVLKVAESKIFNRHYSGYTQASAVAALAARLLEPSLIVSFGTAGGVPGRASVGDVVLADGCLFLDRLRTRNKNAFDWGLWGGGCLHTPRMASALGLKNGTRAPMQPSFSISRATQQLKHQCGRYLGLADRLQRHSIARRHHRENRRRVP